MYSLSIITDKDFRNTIEEETRLAKLDPYRVVLEIRETQTTQMLPEIQSALLELRLKRFGLALDAFGTGTASMSHLKDIPFSILNIDKSVVQQAGSNQSAHAIMESSIELARKLDMQVLAKGIDDEATWQLARNMRCDYGCGDYLGGAMVQTKFVEYINDPSRNSYN